MSRGQPAAYGSRNRRTLQPTISDVARRARVSRATVSRVLNEYPHVRPTVRSAVLRAVRVLRYQPDHVARSLSRRETQTLGLVVADITNPFYAETARAIVETAREQGYHVILCNTDNLSQLQKELLKLRLPPTAIVAGNDLMALGAIQAAGEMGRLAATRMLEIIRDPQRFAHRPVRQVLTPTLVVRRSCGAMKRLGHSAPCGRVSKGWEAI